MSSSLQTLSTLLKQTNIDDHQEILQASEAALKQNKSDTTAQHVRVVALLKLDRYEDAVKAVESGDAHLKELASLEYAYALYKSGQPAEAAEIARGGTGRGYQHVEAQSRYRIEDFARAAELYRELARRLEEDAEMDLRINSGATDAQLEWAGEGEHVLKKKPGREDLEAFETAYNAACGCIARGELAQGEVLLKRASNLCDALEDMTADEKKSELLPIMVQQVYVLARLGRREEAENISASIDAHSISDSSTRRIAQVNRVAASDSISNPFLAQRMVAGPIDSSRADHPFEFQSSTLISNRYAADLQSLKFAGAIDSTKNVLSKEMSPTLSAYHNSLSVINAAAHARSATGKEALKHILPLLEKRPNDIGLLLTIIQLYVLTGNSNSAINLLESFLSRLEQSGSTSDLDVRFAPGLVGAVVSLYHRERRRGHMQRELAKAATHWRRKSKPWPAGVLNLFKTAGRELLESSNEEDSQLASEIFTEVHDHDPTDRYAAAGMLAASQNHSASTKHATVLTPIDRLISQIHASALEDAGIAHPPAPAGAQVTTRKRPAEESKPRKAKKMRKSRIPKDYDPSKKPDPERWLPLRDRSTYRPKGKKGKARANQLSQGAAPGGDSDGSRPATPAAPVVKQQQGGGGNKKKKGKR